jgi:hypothetical protein
MTRDQILERMAEMPSSLNDALRTMDMAAQYIKATGLPQSPLTREAVLAVVLDKNNCGLGDRDADGNYRRIACNDESLEGDRQSYHKDCECSAVADGILALANTRPDRGVGK